MSVAANADLSKLKINRDGGERSSSNPPNKWKMPGIVAGLFLLVGVGGWLYLRSYQSTIEVETTTVSRMFPSQANSVLTATGYVVARQKAAIASKGTGRLVALNVEPGDHVKKDQVIGRLESADVEAALAQGNANANVARANRDQASAEVEDAEKQFSRTQALIKRGSANEMEMGIAETRYKRAKAALASAEAQIIAAEANVSSLRIQLENTFIRAPFDGTILNKNADVGEIVAPFAASASSRAAVVTMADMSSLEVEADVSESNLERVSAGKPCEIVLDAIPDKRYRGSVHKIVPTADRAKATVMTKIRFEELDDKVLPEMSAKIMFLADSAAATNESATPVMVVRRESIVQRDGHTVAFLVRGDRVDAVPVSTGMTWGGIVEVKSGLSDNDVVVSRPPEELKTGAHISIKNK